MIKIFYVKVDVAGVKELKFGDIEISIYQTTPTYYQVIIDMFYLNRLKKLYKLTESGKLKDVLDLIELCYDNEISVGQLIEIKLTEELNRSINQEIIKNLQKIK